MYCTTPFLLQTRNTAAIKVAMTARTMTNARAPMTPPTIGLTETESAHVVMQYQRKEGHDINNYIL